MKKRYIMKKHFEGASQTFHVCGKDLTSKYVFNCLLNDFSDADCLILTGKLFQAVGPAVRNEPLPNLVLVDRVGSVSTPVLKTADRRVAWRSVTVAGTLM